MNVFIIDPALGNIPGHWSTYNELIVNQLIEEDYSPTILSNKNTKDEITKQLPIIKCFANDPYVPWVVHGCFEKTFENIKIFGETYYRDISRQIKVYSKDEIVLICPTITPPILYGILYFISKNPHCKIVCKIIFQFGDGISLNNYKSFENIFGLGYQFVLREFNISSINSSNLRFFASTNEFSYVLNSLLNVKIKSLPMIQSQLAVSYKIKSSNNSSDKLTLGLFGHSSKAKGSEFIYKLLLELFLEDSNKELILHYNPNNNEEPDEIKKLESLNNVLVKRGFLENNQLNELMMACDIIIIPYEPKNYLFMMSAIFIEVVCLDKVTIIPKNTVMWSFINKFNCGVGFNNLNYKHINSSILEAFKNYHNLVENTNLASLSLRHDGSENYVKKLMT